MNRTKVAILWILIATFIMGGIWYFKKQETNRFRRETFSFPIMSTRASVTLIDTDPDEIERAFRLAREAMERVVALCNYFDPSSELARLNASADKTPFVCSPELWEILRETRRFHRLSDGAFDPTIRPLMRVWGFHRKRLTLPSDAEITEAKKICGFDKIRFDDNTRSVFFTVPGMSIDLGGIAKGWAVDKAAEAVLNQTAVRRGWIDLGGNMRCLPLPPPNLETYRIGVRDPKNPDSNYCAKLLLADTSCVTSGIYERYFTVDGVRYHHIIDKDTLCPSTLFTSVTVVTKNSGLADALSTALFCMPLADGEALCEKLGDVEALWVLPDGELHMTSGMEAILVPDDTSGESQS